MLGDDAAFDIGWAAAGEIDDYRQGFTLVEGSLRSLRSDRYPIDEGKNAQRTGEQCEMSYHCLAFFSRFPLTGEPFSHDRDERREGKVYDRALNYNS